MSTMRRSVAAGMVLLLAASVMPARAVMLSKEYEFKPHVELVVGAEARDGREGIRLDTVQFVFPDPSRAIQFSDTVRVDVSISNLGTNPQKVGVAIALFAADGALVGVASGGSKWLAIKPERKSYYSLRFADVDSRIAEAASFRITLESR